MWLELPALGKVNEKYFEVDKCRLVSQRQKFDTLKGDFVAGWGSDLLDEKIFIGRHAKGKFGFSFVNFFESETKRSLFEQEFQVFLTELWKNGFLDQEFASVRLQRLDLAQCKASFTLGLPADGFGPQNSAQIPDSLRSIEKLVTLDQKIQDAALNPAQYVYSLRNQKLLLLFSPPDSHKLESENQDSLLAALANLENYEVTGSSLPNFNRIRPFQRSQFFGGIGHKFVIDQTKKSIDPNGIFSNSHY